MNIEKIQQRLESVLPSDTVVDVSYQTEDCTYINVFAYRSGVYIQAYSFCGVDNLTSFEERCRAVFG